jgi:hypothetical protein
VPDAPPPLPSALAPLPIRPRVAAMLAVAVTAGAVTWASYGLTLTLLLALGFALPKLWRGEGRKAAWALVVGGALPLALGLALMASYELDKAGSTDPLFVEKNHESGFWALLFVLGAGVPSLFAGAVTALLAARSARWAARRSLDAADDAVAGAGLACGLVGAGSLGVLGFASIALGPVNALLPGLAVAPLGFVVVREVRRRRALGALHAGALAGLALAARGDGDGDVPALVDPRGAPLELAVVSDAPAGEGPYRRADGRVALALAPAGARACTRASTRRLVLAAVALCVDAAVLGSVPLRLLH